MPTIEVTDEELESLQIGLLSRQTICDQKLIEHPQFSFYWEREKIKADRLHQKLFRVWMVNMGLTDDEIEHVEEGAA